MYGLHFGVVDMPNGEQRLVMVDKNASWGQLARKMGFLQSRWYGVWVRSDLRFNIPGYSQLFPRGRIVRLSDAEIKQQIKVPLAERREMRLSQMNGQRASRRLSWHPSRLTPVAEAVAVSVDAPAAEVPTVAADIALRQTVLLGRNHLGQEVFESGDGTRFTQTDDTVVAREQDQSGGPAFLRSSTDADLVLCAAGLVDEVASGRALHSDDFERYLTAIFGESAIEDKDVASRFQLDIDKAMLQRAAQVPGTGRDAFDRALRLHEGRPSYWRQPGTLPTPLPLAMVMQSLVSEAAVDADTAVLDITAQAQAHSWSFPQSVAAIDGEYPAHRVTLGGVFSHALNEGSVSVNNVRVTRADHLAILKSLKSRDDKGLSAFIIAGDKSNGMVDAETRRLLSHLGAHYEIRGLVDVDAHMISPGNTVGSRLLVVGPRLERVDYTFAVPATVPVIYDYDSLWNWAETLRVAGKDEMSFGEDGREENRWQAPYIPSSQLSEPKAMSPRNLLGPVRRALARIVETTGMGIDDYVADRLQWSVQEMESKGYLDAEQCDAVALMIFASEQNAGFVQSDATGLGKGRTLAAMMRYHRLNNKPVVFLTEKAALFRDIYRDIEDIGSLELFRNPLILNNDIILRAPDGSEIGRSPKREVLQRALSSDAVPADYSMVLATYSQFNRRVTGSAHAVGRLLGMRDQCLDGTLDRHAAVNELAESIGVLVADAGGAADNATAIANLEALHLFHAPGSEVDLRAKRQIELRKMSNEDFAEIIRGLVPTDTSGLKRLWLNSKALDGAFIAMDESHNAAGPDSQTNEAMRGPVARGSSIAYSSATFAKDTRNFGLYSRIFPPSVQTDAIPGVLDRGGEPLQEILSAGLAEDGRTIRREHDLSSVEIRVRVDDGRRERNVGWSDGLADVLAAMSLLSGEISSAVGTMNSAHQKAAQAKQNAKAAGSNSKTAQIGVQYTNFSSRFYTVNRAFQMAMSADHAADLAIAALKAGRKPVITVENTLETILTDLVSAALEDGVEVEHVDVPAAPASTPAAGAVDPLAGLGGDLLDPLSPADAAEVGDVVGPANRGKRGVDVIPMGRRVGFREILRKYADNIFYAWEVKRKGNTIVSRKRLNLKTPELAEGIKAVYELIDNMPDVPLSPLDVVRDRITREGYTIDELSGRKLRVIDNGDGTDSVARMGERNKVALVDKFNAGELDAVLLSKSGSTGISLHASHKFADQSRRELIELQPAADIAQRIQFWGRVNRKGQVNSPIITLVSTGLPGEKRLMTMQNARLRKLSANVSGNADNSAIAEDAPDILNRVGNEVCFRWLEGNPEMAKRMGVDLTDMSETDPSVRYGTRWVDSLTGKISMLHVHEQEQVYSEIEAEFRAVIEQYELEGRNPLKSGEHDIRAKKVRGHVHELPPSTDGSVFSGPVMANEIEYVVKAKALDADALLADAKAGREALQEAWGGIRWMENLKNAIEAQKDELMPFLVSSKFPTVEAALAAEEPNAVKNLEGRCADLRALLSKTVPGSFLRVGTGFLDSDLHLVVGLELPKDPKRLVAPADYKLKMISSRTRRTVKMTMSSLIALKAGVFDEASYGWKQYDKFLPGLMGEFTEDREWTIRRVIMDGNLFRAAMIADQNRAGQAVTYSDERGVWNHAILLPATVTYDRLNDMPLDLTTPELLAGLLEEHDFVSVHDSQRQEDMRFGLGKKRGGNDIEIRLYKGAEASAWALGSKEIEECLVGGWQGTRLLRHAKVNPMKIHEFSHALLRAAAAGGVRVMTNGSLRPWSIEFAQRQREASAALVTAKAGVVDAGAELEKELASLGI